MACLTDELLRQLGNAVRAGVRARSMRYADGSSPRFELGVEVGGHWEKVGADAVVLATPSFVAAELVALLAPRCGELLASIEYAPVAVVSGGYRAEQVGESLDGFGFLVPQGAGLNVLGTVWNSSIFPERAPGGCVALTSFAGGAMNPSIVTRAPEEIAAVVEKEVARVLEITSQPVARHIQRHTHAIPQCNLGHATRIARLQDELDKYPALFLTGNYRNGPAIGACVESGFRAAADVHKLTVC